MQSHGFCGINKDINLPEPAGHTLTSTAEGVAGALPQEHAAGCSGGRLGWCPQSCCPGTFYWGTGLRSPTLRALCSP